nr:hypothetical protein CFP56_46406 [Quercus suber]
MPPIPPIDTRSPSRFTHAEFEFSPPTTTVNHNSPMALSYSSPQTVIPTPSLQTPHIEPMSTSPSHTQSPPTSSTLIHVPQATHPHDSDVEQGQRDQAKQPQDANAHATPKRKLTCAIQPRSCSTSSYMSMFRPNSTLDATRKEVNAGKVQPNKGCCSLEILTVHANGQFCGAAEMQMIGSKIDGVGSKNMQLGIIGVLTYFV